MNVYDKLNELTRAIAQSREFIEYKNTAEKVDSNELHSQMLKSFVTAQMQLSTANMLGQEPTEEMIASFNSLYSTIVSIKDINDFLAAQASFSIIMEDISKEISKAATIDVSFLNILPEGSEEELS
ncbi:MAG: YlbF family regulator [Eubacteriaceae bacterium]|nr:YlbF family regulator [Eubacteriaceae bacterium]